MKTHLLQGFPAIDYMLYGIESDSNLVINKYQSIDGYKYTNYLSSLINQMISNTDQIINYWQTDRDDFISSTGNTATSSLNKLTNDFIYYYEKELFYNCIYFSYIFSINDIKSDNTWSIKPMDKI